MLIKIKKLTANAVTPSYANPGDAGMDLTATSISIVDTKDYGYIEYGTGIAVDIPEGFVGLLYPRSSISKTGMWLANAVGLIDSGYKGEIKARFKAIPNTKIYDVGERIAQLVLMPVMQVTIEETDILSESERGEGGFGSTGK